MLLIRAAAAARSGNSIGRRKCHRGAWPRWRGGRTREIGSSIEPVCPDAVDKGVPLDQCQGESFPVGVLRVADHNPAKVVTHLDAFSRSTEGTLSPPWL